MYWYTNTVVMPRFVSVPLAAFSENGGGSQVTQTGPEDYPAIASRAPDQWLNEWSFPSGCPPMPAVTGIKARPRAGAVTLTWPVAALGLAYHVSLQPLDAARPTPGTTVSPVLSASTHVLTVTFSGLPAGRYTGTVVPVNIRQHTGQAGQVTFTVPAG
jgi:hypothetical protein